MGTLKVDERPTVVDLFAGVGGLSYGFVHGGFRVIAANEILPAMAQAYRLNHPEVPMFEGDIKDFGRDAIKSSIGSRAKLPTVDVVVGGPPCQAYSTVGKRLLDDPRGALFQEYFRILQELKPKVFIFENVKGLLSMQNHELLPRIVDLFESINYQTQVELLNAADYGAPQMRERVIIVGTRRGLNFKYPAPTHASEAEIGNGSVRIPHLTLGEAISDLTRIEAGETGFSYSSKPKNEFQELMRIGAPKQIMDHTAPTHNAELMAIIRALPEGGGPLDIPEKIRPKSGFPNTYSRLWWDRPSTTVTRNLGTPSSSRCVHPISDRALTTREGARLQCFPDSYQFFGSRAQRNLQIGNAVPTFLSRALASRVLAALAS